MNTENNTQEFESTPLDTKEEATRNDKNIYFIIAFTALLIAIFAFSHFYKEAKEKKEAESIMNNNAPSVSHNVVGDLSATIDANINLDVLREIDFSMSKDEVASKEALLNDTLDNPSIANGTDGYTYITYASNPEEPLSLFGISASLDDSISTGLAYVFVNDALTELRFQFGTISEDDTQALINQFCSQYGQYTYSSSHDSSFTYNWKTADSTLILSRDVLTTEFDNDGNVINEIYGTTVFFRK